MPGLSSELGVIWVLHATPEGQVVTPLPATTPSSSQQQPALAAGVEGGKRQADWLLIDGLQVGRSTGGQTPEQTRERRKKGEAAHTGKEGREEGKVLSLSSAPRQARGVWWGRRWTELGQPLPGIPP